MFIHFLRGCSKITNRFGARRGLCSVCLPFGMTLYSPPIMVGFGHRYDKIAVKANYKKQCS